MAQFVHLRVHSQYSILDASASLEVLVQKAVAENMPALALTDHGNLFGAVDFYKACNAAKIKSILGCEIYVARTSRFEKSRIFGVSHAHRITLLAYNQDGYRALCKLSSAAYLEGFYEYPRIDDELLEKYKDGLICLDGSIGTRLGHEIIHGTEESATQRCLFYQQLFGENYYLDLQRHAMTPEAIQADGLHQEAWLLQQHEEYVKKQQKINERLILLSQKHGIPLVATNDIHYLKRDDWHAHEILINIQTGQPCEILEKDSYGNAKGRIANPKRHTYPTHEYYFKTADQMEQLFADQPQALENTLLIAQKCQVFIDLKNKYYPAFSPPNLEQGVVDKVAHAQAIEEFLWKLCQEGISKRYTDDKLAKIKKVFPNEDPLKMVNERLHYEMSIIIPKGMGDYLLIVWDFISWAKRQGIAMGPGRGSGVGSIVLYLIGVTDIEPLHLHLFFERFINPERISYPDIDVDICMHRREEVIAYTLQKYGRDNVAQIITFGTMKAKMAIKDVGRILSVPLAKVNTITKLVPDDLNITIDQALEKDRDLQALYQEDAEVTRLLDLARTLEGSIRNTGIHAAGIIISALPLTELIPICSAKDSDMPVTQFSMKPVEAVGMLKVDFLGLKTLTAIQMCVNAIEVNHQKSIDWVDLPLDDQATFDLLNQGKTLGIFQLESGGMQDLARQLHLDCFEELIAVGALYRPGPMDMIPSFINRKHGVEPIEYDHPEMQDILAETYGIMIYQEQVMQIASTLANFSLGEGDVLRRAMGKKDLEQMAQQRAKFREGALLNKIDEETSMAIFDKMEKFASYGFNKSHAAAYGYLSYVTAYLKANFPGEWMAALMTCDRDDLSKIAKFIGPCQSMNISMLPPDVNEAGEVFQATPQGIRFAMTGIKGVGSGAVQAIISERQKNGLFKTFYDFYKRIDSKKVGKKVIENLAWAGCFDFTGWSRDALVLAIEPLHKAVAQQQKDDSYGFLSLFAALGDDENKRFSEPPVVPQKSSRQELLLREKELLGFFLTGHPMDQYQAILQRLSCVPFNQIDQMNQDTVFRTAFIVEAVEIKVASKSQRKFAVLIISDGIDRRELPIWFDLYEQKSHLLHENQLLYAVLEIEKKENDLQLHCRWLDDLTKANEEMVAACDQAYDKAKQHSKRPSYPKAQVKVNQIEPKEVKIMKSITVKLDANQTRFSHILQLKKLFLQHAGSHPIQIQFCNGPKLLASLDIDSRWGVTFDAQFSQKLQNISVVLGIE